MTMSPPDEFLLPAGRPILSSMAGWWASPL